MAVSYERGTPVPHAILEAGLWHTLRETESERRETTGERQRAGGGGERASESERDRDRERGREGLLLLAHLALLDLLLLLLDLQPLAPHQLLQSKTGVNLHGQS